MTSDDTTQADEVSIPSYVTKNSIAPFIKTYFKRNSLTKPLSTDDFDNMYEDLVTEKKAHYLAENPRAKQLPEAAKDLNFSEVAVIIMALFQFRNIRLSTLSKQYVLGVYIEEPHERAGIYSTDKDTIKRLIEPFAPHFKDKDFDETMKKIERNVPLVDRTTDKDLVPVQNGVFNKADEVLEDFSPDYIFTNKIPHAYVEDRQNPVITMPDGETWNVDDWLTSLMAQDDEIKLLWEVIADTLQPNYTRRKSIWFYSKKGNNGKGTFGQLIKNLLGVGNYSSLSVADFKHEFLKEQLIDVSANISDENDVNLYIDSVRDYKASITGDDILVNRKNEKAVSIKFYGTNLQMLNGLPKTSDRSGSLYRRLVIVPFLVSFTENGERPYIKDDYIHREEVLEYVLKKALHMNFDEFTIPSSSKRLLEEYKETNSPVLQFWAEFKEEFQWQLLPTQFLYDLYLEWFSQVNPRGKPLSRQTFMDELIPIAEEDGYQNKTKQKDKVRTSNRMDADEPLITDWNLTGWMNPAHQGKQSAKLMRDFNRKKTYRGLLKE